MPSDRNRLIEDISRSSLALDPEDRAAYLEQACQGDADLKDAVEARLAQYRQARAYFGDLAQRLGLGSLDDPRLSVGEGQYLGKYRIETLIGQGGMGVVYRATDTQLGRPVALKFLAARYIDDAQANERFMREARAAAALSHPNILTVHDIIEHNGLSVIVMEYIEGQTLRHVLQAGPLAIADALDYAEQIAEGLAVAHGAGVVHRDLKPANVMVTAGGRVQILDFGLAKLRDASLITEEGATMGTVAYMSPEQARGEEVDARSDIWSLGVITYEMLSGERPFKGEHDQAVIHAILNQEPASLTDLKPEVSSELARVVHRALSKTPSDRYETTKAFLADLTGTVDSTPQRTLKQRSTRERPSALTLSRALVAVVLGVLLIGAGLWWLNQAPIPDETVAAVPALAVLPLENHSGEPEDYFANGMTEELISMLSRIEGIRVIPRRTVMQFQGGSHTIEEIARELGVDYIVDGSVLLADNQVRINVQLIESKDDAVMWTERYARIADEIIALQQNVASDIMQAVQVELTSQDKVWLNEPRQVSKDALLLYYQGMQAQDRFDMEEAIHYYEQSIAVDSLFARAYAAMTIPSQMSGDRDKAEWSSRRAIALDNDLPESYVARAMWILFDEHDLPEVERLLQRALKLDPNSVRAQFEYATILFRMGRYEDAWKEMERAYALEPLSNEVLVGLAHIGYSNRKYAEAIEYGLKVLETTPFFRHATHTVAKSYFMRDGAKVALDFLERYLATSPAEDRYYLDVAYLYALAGEQDRVRSSMDALIASVDPEDGTCSGIDQHFRRVSISRIYYALQDYDQMFYWLERMYRGCPMEAIPLLEDPMLDDLRGHPRYEAMIKSARVMLKLEE